jgi:hypothetical protein
VVAGGCVTRLQAVPGAASVVQCRAWRAGGGLYIAAPAGWPGACVYCWSRRAVVA